MIVGSLGHTLFSASLLLCCIIPCSSFAQEGSLSKMELKKMTLKECMEYALRNSVKMRIQATERDDEQLSRREAILQLFTPSLSGNSNVYEKFGRDLDPETNSYVTTTTFNNTYSLSASLTLFDGFKALNNLRISRTMCNMGISKEQRTADEISLATMEAYCNVLYYSKLADIIDEQVIADQKALQTARRQEELGMKSRADVVQAESGLAEKELRLAETKNKRDDALLLLKDIMFFPIAEPLLIDDGIINPSVEAHGAVSRIAEYAKAFNPRALIAEGTLNTARLEWQRSRWSLAPKLILYGGWSTSYYSYPGKPEVKTPTFGRQFSNNMGEYVQLTLSIPIFNRFAAHREIKRKKNAYLRASAEYDQTMRDIENEVYRAVNERDGAEAALNRAEKLVKVQEEAYALSAKKYQQGIISAVEYQTVSGKYLEAQSSRLDASLKYYLKSAVVRYYNGESYLNQ